MKYYQSNKRMYPVVVREDGSIMLHHAQTGAPLEKQTADMIRSFGGAENLLNLCKESPAKDMEEFGRWSNKVESARNRILRAGRMLDDAERELEKLQHRLKDYSYAETKAMGCIAQVEWHCDIIENPKTGNEFFTPEDAHKMFDELLEQHREELEQQRKNWWGGPKEHPITFDEYFNMFYEVCEDASAFLDDLIREEESEIYDES